MRNLVIIPVLNKIDIKHANPERVCKDLHNLFGINPNNVLKVRYTSILKIYRSLIVNI